MVDWIILYRVCVQSLRLEFRLEGLEIEVDRFRLRFSGFGFDVLALGFEASGFCFLTQSSLCSV